MTPSDHPMFGWTGKILRVDLTTRESWVQDSAPLAEKYLGGRGFGVRIAWDELEPGTGAFDPENPLMAFTGPLCGTSAPCSAQYAERPRISSWKLRTIVSRSVATPPPCR